MIKAFEYYRIKNILIDLIIFNNENNVYERYVDDAINSIISERQLQYLKNVSGGIFILNKKNCDEDDIFAIKAKSRLTINAKKGDLATFLKENSENRVNFEKNIKAKIVRINQEIFPLKKEELLYNNDFGGFSLDGKEYIIYKNEQNKLPAVWSNVLANKFFGSIVTDGLGGYIWYKNSRLNRMTAWNNNSVYDFPSEIYYIKDEDNGEFWTVNSSVNPNQNYYYIRHGFGYSCFQNNNDNLIQNVDVFVPEEENVKILNFRIKNIVNENRHFKILVYIKPVVGEDEFLTNGNILLQKINNIILVKNSFPHENFKEKTMYVTSTEKIKSFTGEKINFFGNGDVYEPDSLYRNMNNKSGFGKDCCVGLELDIEIGKLEDKKFTILIGDEANVDLIQNISEKYKDEDEITNRLENVKNKWNNILNNVNVKTPSESINILMNGWLTYQTISSRIYARSGYYQSGGAFGFRDQLQDCLGLKYIDSSFLREQIINCARHQFIEGDVLHWWHQETKRGIRTRFSDDLLWLVYSVLEYVDFTNQYDILDEEVAYLKGNLLQENELEKYDLFHESDIKENIFEHCIRSIENVIAKGLEPFPKIGVGDWNDGFSNVGSKRKRRKYLAGIFLI